MTLLAPLWLLLAGAVAVPLLVHLLRRQSGARSDFPAARYLARAEREHSRSLRLRNLLLMLLRVAVVVLLALAAARPAAAWLMGAWDGGRSPTALAIVVDNSMSTGVVRDGRRVFDVLRNSARAAVGAALPSDRVWIVAADGVVHGGTPAGARAALDSLTPLVGRGDLGLAIRRGAAAAGGAAAHAARVAVFTDGQRSAWTADVGAPTGTTVALWTPGASSPANRGVVHAEPQPARWTPGGALAIRLHAPDSVAYRVVLGPRGGQERTVARGTAAPGADLLLRLAASDTGWLVGRVEIDPDELDADDVRHFVLWAGAPPRVDASAGAGPFVASALSVLRSEGRVVSGTEVRVSAAHEPVPGAGAVLLAAPASPSDIGAANRGLERLGIPWRYGRSTRGRLRARDGVDGVVVRSAYELVAAAPADVDTLATLDSRPWAVAGDAGALRYVLVGSTLHAEATDLPVRAAFVPWLAEVITERLATGGGRVVHAGSGTAIAPPVDADSLRRASGTTVAVPDGPFAVPNESGVHFFVRGGRTTGALVVNAEGSESVLERATKEEVAARITGARVTQLADAPGWREALFANGTARSLITPLLMAVLMLLGAELASTAFRARGVT